MALLPLLEKLSTASKSSFCILDEKKSKRMGGVATLYIPSVEEVAEVIRAIPPQEKPGRLPNYVFAWQKRAMPRQHVPLKL